MAFTGRVQHSSPQKVEAQTVPGRLRLLLAAIC